MSPILAPLLLVISPGAFKIEGTYTQTATGNLLVELAGDFSRSLRHSPPPSGPATLAGDLELALLADFVPAYDDSFTIRTASSLTRQFSNASTQLTFDAGTFDILYTPTSLTLTHFTPVPRPDGALRHHHDRCRRPPSPPSNRPITPFPWPTPSTPPILQVSP